ncbi:MAG: hypothetical protein VB095_12080 [Anaerovorax sp.]|nr:hypothetical protein [Anaerovorax sp.]
MDLGNLTSKELGQIMSEGLLRAVQNGEITSISEEEKQKIIDSNME